MIGQSELPLELLRYELLLPAFALVLARVAGLVLAVPMLTSQEIPSVVKAWLVVTLSLMVFPAVSPLLSTQLTLSQVATGMVGEFIIGEVLGLAVGMIFMAVQIAGKMISHQSGMSMGESYNPIMDESSTVLDQVWFFAVLMFFLALRGHVAVVTSLLGSFERVPPMMATMDVALLDCVMGLLRSMFDIALRLCGPVVLALLLTSLILGFLTKTMPQLNVLSVGFAFKVAATLFMLAITLPLSEGIVADGLADGFDHLGRLFEQMAERVSGSAGSPAAFNLHGVNIHAG